MYVMFMLGKKILFNMCGVYYVVFMDDGFKKYYR